ncbi:aminotransferase class I/II-fold pyridoxal phosphate-dependent enzyme [Alteromonas sp. H39]|uniref:aminotransferase class I/II-fold pyridoxal phosphate-dependent enzyme n=1 Tax=Alteromonas sp. H39 TaxID=3389876 RepID=UPI0039E136BF
MVIDHNPTRLANTKQYLESVTHALDRDDLTLALVTASSSDEATAELYSDGDIQAAILSWETEESLSHDESVIDAIKAIRHELPVYVTGEDDIGFDIVKRSNRIEAFFALQDLASDPESTLAYIVNDFDDRSETPFWTAYKKYAVETNDSWHTPGHSGGASFRGSSYINDFYKYFGRNMFISDLSVSVDSLGSLSDGTNAIGKAQNLVASTFEVKHSYFVTNGSSTSNKIILQTLLREGDKVIVDRNCHKSVHYGVVQARALPLYLDSILDPKYGIFAPPSLAQLKVMIDDNQDATLIVLTGCTYDGLLTDLRQVVDYAHQFGIKVFIDEAWFAYSLFHPQFRQYSAINAGADYVTHSAHKVVSAFSQASYIHINDPDFDKDFFKEVYAIHTSTSPQYQLIASLDVCRKQLEMEGFKIINNLLRHVQELKEQAEKFTRIRILDEDDFKQMFSHFETDSIGHDPLKILIDISELSYSNQEIHRFLMDEVGLEIEKFTHSTLLVLLTFGGMRSKIVRLFNALNKLDSGHVSLRRSNRQKPLPVAIPPIHLATLPSDAFFGKRELVELKNSVGRIAAALITPYPPGIPLLVPGQKIEQAHLEYLDALSNQKLTIQGLHDSELYVLEE